MSKYFQKSWKLQYLIVITFLVLSGLWGGLVVSLPSRAEISPFTEKLVTMDFKDTDLKDAIGMLSVMTGWNIVVDKDVEGKVNVRFENIPALHILERILEINECQYEIEDNIIIVSKMAIISESFPLEYALASSVAPFIDTFLSSEGSFQLDEATNTIIISDKKKSLEEVTAFIREIDTPAKQLQKKSFTLKFIPVDSVVFLLDDYLSQEGKIKIDASTNSLFLTETSRNFAQLEELILNLDVHQPIEEIFTLKYALASSVAPLLESYLAPEDSFKISEQTNEIIVSSDLYTLIKIGQLLDSLDLANKQISEKSFTVKYVYLEEAASVVEENLSSWGEIIERNEARSMLIIKDTSYNLSKIEKLIEQRDIFIPLKKTYEIKFAPVAFLAEQADALLSDKGTLQIKEEAFRFTVTDVKKNLDKIDSLVKKEDILERQLISPVQFEEENLRDVLSLLSQEAGINIFVSPEVKGKVTLRLGKPIPFLEVLEAILRQNYSQYEIEDNIIIVSKMAIFRESFSLEYALASSLASSVNALLSSEGDFQLDEATNTIIVSDKKASLGEIAAFIREIDTPKKQLRSKSFSIKFLLADKVASLLEDYLSAEGKIKIDPLANSLLLTETSRNFAELEKLILDSDVYQPKEEIFTLKYALASSVGSLVANYLGPEDKLQVNEQANEIVLSSSPYTLERTRGLLDSLDVADKQISEKSFSIKYYLDPEELAALVKENLSSLGEIKLDKSRDILIVKDTSYSLSGIEKIIKESDASILLKKTYQMKYAPWALMAEPLRDLLSDKGTLEVKEKISRFIAIDVKNNVDKIDNLVKEMDILANRLVEKRYLLEYLTPEEAKDYLRLKNIISEYGEIRLPVVTEKIGAGNVNGMSDYIIIPQEMADNPEEIKVESAQVDLLEEEENVIYITDLKRNIQKIDEAIKEMNGSSRAEEIISQTFYIREGSLERMALAMANILGIKPGDIEGLEPKGEWMQMEVPTLEINLGTVGPR